MFLVEHYWCNNDLRIVDLHRNWLYRAVRLANVEGILGFSRKHMWHEFKRSWFVIRDWWSLFRVSKFVGQ